jgi:ribonuclease HII
MAFIEETLSAAGITKVAGVDEAGRGPCAGPLVIAAVILSDFKSPALSKVRDSKELSEKVRESLYDVIIHEALA